MSVWVCLLLHAALFGWSAAELTCSWGNIFLTKIKMYTRGVHPIVTRTYGKEKKLGTPCISSLLSHWTTFLTGKKCWELHAAMFQGYQHRARI